MSIVLDSSVTVAWYFADERTAAIDAVLSQVTESGAIVPSLWRLEVANALHMAVKRKRIEAAYRDVSLDALRSLAIDIDSETDTHAWSSTLRLAERFQLTLYDAAYLELAQRRGVPLASLDQDLREAGAALSITLLGI